MISVTAMSSLTIAALTALLDQWSKKRFMETIGTGGCRYILGDRVRLSHLENEGAFMGLFKEDKEKLKAFNLGAMAAILLLMVSSRSRLVRFGLALVLGGAAGNHIDRIVKGSVTDFIAFSPRFKVHFNIADFAIFAGAASAFIGQLAEQKG